MDLGKLKMAVDFNDVNLWICAATVVWSPLFWNVVGRLEFRTRFLTKLCGSSRRAVAVMATLILGFGFYRDWRFFELMNTQPHWTVTSSEALTWKWAGNLVVAIGTLLVLSSTYKLGLCNTFLGDYFGILMDKKVDSFPFNVLNHPMFAGSALNFIGSALSQTSTSGLLMCALVIACYAAATIVEGPFTEQIYALADKYRRGQLSRSHPAYQRIADAVRDLEERTKNK